MNEPIQATLVASVLACYLQAHGVKAVGSAIRRQSDPQGPTQWPHACTQYSLNLSTSPRAGWVFDVYGYDLHSERLEATPLISVTVEAGKNEMLLLAGEIHDLLSMIEDAGIQTTLEHMRAHIRAVQKTVQTARTFGAVPA